MRRHYTPPAIAAYVAKFVPSNAKNVLDPCVGEGELIAPLISNLSTRATFTCVDKSQHALQSVRKRFKWLGERLLVSEQDFLEWRPTDDAAMYDCVVMNPPFSAKRNSWKELSSCAPDERYKKVPVEAAFALKALNHLGDKGLLVAILPSSLVAGTALEWVRQRLCKQGQVVVVHELAPYSFKDIEGSFFVVVYKKQRCAGTTILLNHSLVHPERSTLVPKSANPELRLDFAFNEAVRKLHSATGLRKELAWKSLDHVASVVRGEVSAPFPRSVAVLHTSHFSTGFWRAPETPGNGRNLSAWPKARSGDLMISRVGRSSVEKIGLLINSDEIPFSDCLLRIRPRDGSSILLLLAIRSMYSGTDLRSLLELGTGAKYITARYLKRCLVPTKVPAYLERLTKQYADAIRDRDAVGMKEIETACRSLLLAY